MIIGKMQITEGKNDITAADKERILRAVADALDAPNAGVFLSITKPKGTGTCICGQPECQNGYSRENTMVYQDERKVASLILGLMRDYPEVDRLVASQRVQDVIRQLQEMPTPKADRGSIQ